MPHAISKSQPLPQTKSRSVALVEDQPEIRDSWARLIAWFPDFACVCMCSSGEDTLRSIPPLQRDAILMDIFLPRMSGIECTARVKGLVPKTRILILTAADD